MSPNKIMRLLRKMTNDQIGNTYNEVSDFAAKNGVVLPGAPERYEAGKQDQDIINYVIALILLFLLLPVALGNFFNVTTTSWSADVVTIWNILPILAIIGAFGMVLYMAYNKSGLGKKK